MKLTEKYINNLYSKLKRHASKNFSLGNYDDCLQFIKVAAHTAYTFHLGFKDDELEYILQRISSHLKTRNYQENCQKNRCVFFDSFSLDNRGLTQQYLRAIFNAGWEVLYISNVSFYSKASQGIISELSSSVKSTVVSIPAEVTGLSRSQFIYDRIVEYKPSKLFMHLSPSEVYAVTAFYALPEHIVKYQINLTDHAFWLGVGCLDYSLEFRKYGARLTEECRGISSERILVLPYYPIVNAFDFKGLPALCNGKVVIFSGGAYYKIIDKDNTFFLLIKRILDSNNDVIIIYAGDGDDTPIKKFIEDNGYQDKVLLLGFRSDINEVFKHCDIYLNTFPVGGGLMSQYAAINSKPILNYDPLNRKEIEGIVCQVDNVEISYSTEDSFIKEAERLIKDERYRVIKGKKTQVCILDEKDFNRIFLVSVNERVSQISYSGTSHIGNEMKISDRIRFHNITKDFQWSLLKIFRYKIVLLFPGIAIDGYLSFLSHRIKSRFPSSDR